MLGKSFTTTVAQPPEKVPHLQRKSISVGRSWMEGIECRWWCQGHACCCPWCPKSTHMLGLVDSESRVNAAMLGVPLCQSAGTVERNALLLRSRRIRACRFCQDTGSVLESWFWLRSATVKAVRVLHAAGKGPVRL